MAFHRPGAMKPTPPIMKALKSVVWYQVRPVTLTEPEARSTSAILRGRGERSRVAWRGKDKANGTKQALSYTVIIQI